MASHPLGSGAVPPSEWQASANAYTRNHVISCMRAAVIALVLLAVLALIVLT